MVAARGKAYPADLTPDAHAGDCTKPFLQGAASCHKLQCCLFCNHRQSVQFKMCCHAATATCTQSQSRLLPCSISECYVRPCRVMDRKHATGRSPSTMSGSHSCVCVQGTWYEEAKCRAKKPTICFIFNSAGVFIRAECCFVSFMGLESKHSMMQTNSASICLSYTTTDSLWKHFRSTEQQLYTCHATISVNIPLLLCWCTVCQYSVLYKHVNAKSAVLFESCTMRLNYGWSHYLCLHFPADEVSMQLFLWLGK